MSERPPSDGPKASPEDLGKLTPEQLADYFRKKREQVQKKIDSSEKILQRNAQFSVEKNLKDITPRNERSDQSRETNERIREIHERLRKEYTFESEGHASTENHFSDLGRSMGAESGPVPPNAEKSGWFSGKTKRKMAWAAGIGTGAAGGAAVASAWSSGSIAAATAAGTGLGAGLLWLAGPAIGAALSILVGAIIEWQVGKILWNDLIKGALPTSGNSHAPKSGGQKKAAAPAHH